MGDAVAGLLHRELGEDSADYVTRALPDESEADGNGDADDNDADRFEIRRLEDGRIELAGTTPLARAAAFGWHCRHPYAVPAQRGAAFAYRYFYNVCTFGYTSAFWDWSQWERELDDLAMRGVNLPLALVGQEAVWQRVLRRFGMADDAIRAFLGGPAYLPWLWMGCLRGWDGPMPQSWIDRHAELGSRIVDRMRELGMTPVLPAFAGHVPPELAKCGRATEVPWVGDFSATLLDPTDPFFGEIAEAHFAEQEALFGSREAGNGETRPFFAADPFIEMVPPVEDPDRLAELARSLHDRMRAVHPRAVWVLQSWPFSYKADYWTSERKRAFLDAVPDDGMLLLDLWADYDPNVEQLGVAKPRAWCMLNNFGGRPGMYGNLRRIAEAPTTGAIGLGATMEDSRTNPVVYDLWADVAWGEPTTGDGGGAGTDVQPDAQPDIRPETPPADAEDRVPAWLSGWVRRRYRDAPADRRPVSEHGVRTAQRAWELLADLAYASTRPGPVGSVVLLRPSLAEPLVPAEWSSSEAPRPETLPAELTEALRLLLAAVPEGEPTPRQVGRDLADVSFLTLGLEANLAQQRAADAYRAGMPDDFEDAAGTLLRCIDDLEAVLATRPEYLLGRWVADAARWGESEAERAYYRSDALRLLTLWGPPGEPLVDYARRGWAGLMGDFYRTRWQRWVDHVRDILAGRGVADAEAFDRELAEFETSFVQGPPAFATHPSGDTAAVLRDLGLPRC